MDRGFFTIFTVVYKLINFQKNMLYSTLVDKSEATMNLLIARAQEFDQDRVLDGLDTRHYSVMEVRKMTAFVTEHLARMRHEYVQSLEMSHDTPQVFVDFIAERIIATQMDLLRLLADGGVNGARGGVNLAEQMVDAISRHPGMNAPALAALLQKSLRTTQRYLKSLSDAGKIAFRGAPKNGGYHIVEKPAE